MRWTQIREHVTGWELADALEHGLIQRLSAGLYSVADCHRGELVARRSRGVLSHSSAALHWGFALAPGPDIDHVTVRRNAHLAISGVQVHYRDLEPSDVDGLVTSPLQTVIDCLRDLPLRDAFAVGDSALRSGSVSAEELAVRAGKMRGPGSARIRQRAQLLDGRSANAFESVCRAILVEGDVQGFEPQLTIRHRGQFLGRVDLGNITLRILIECESFTWHGDSTALARDCRRHTEFEAAGWHVLRFTWKTVMFESAWVLARVKDMISAVGRR